MNKLYDAIMGLVVGDALGVPFEFKTRDTFRVTDMVGYGTHGQEPGTWSDDSSLALATLESIGRCKKIDPADIMKNFAYWLCDSCFTANGTVFDVGGTTGNAIVKYCKTRDITSCGGREHNSNGNGSLMRILPLAFIPHTNADVYNVSALTHAHEISVMACQYYLAVAEKLLDGADKTEAVRSLERECKGVFSRVPVIDRSPREVIKSSGYVVDTLEAALWCFLKTDSYRECVITAVELGSDTDTVAAVAGGLAGIYYGVGGDKGIPEEWIEKIARKSWIGKLCAAACVD